MEKKRAIQIIQRSLYRELSARIEPSDRTEIVKRNKRLYEIMKEAK